MVQILHVQILPFCKKYVQNVQKLVPNVRAEKQCENQQGFNTIQDGPFRGCSRSKKVPLP